jgi:hypothetical protein
MGRSAKSVEWRAVDLLSCFRKMTKKEILAWGRMRGCKFVAPCPTNVRYQLRNPQKLPVLPH